MLHTTEQVVIFRRQIELAIETGLPLMLHIRPSGLGSPERSDGGKYDAYEDALDILEEYKTAAPEMTGTAHFFAGIQSLLTGF